MLRFVRGGSQRSIVSAVAATAVAALTVSGCTGSSSGGGPSPSPSGPTPSTTSASPDTIGQDATTTLKGSATITLGSSAPVSVASSTQQPVTLELSPSGAATLQLSMRNRSGDLFSLSGPARSGSVTTDAISVLLLDAGAIVDTAAGNPCTTSYDAVSETAVRGTVRCQTLSGQQKVPVIVRFSAS